MPLACPQPNIPQGILFYRELLLLSHEFSFQFDLLGDGHARGMPLQIIKHKKNLTLP